MCMVRALNPFHAFLSQSRLTAAWALALAAALGSAVSAQPAAQSTPQLPRPSWSPPALIAASTGVVRADGGVLALGPGYRALLSAGGSSFGPPDTAAVIRWRLESVGRERSAAQVRVGSDAEPDVVGDNTAVYRHAGCTERYEARTDGLEQSFVFDELPPGSGDLVVRLRVRTELRPSVVGAFTEQLVFTSSEGGVAFDAITGIDADGIRSPGLMRCEGERLDFVLPGAFVDEARMPLTLDPLVSGQFTVGAAGSSLVAWDVSYDATNDVFLVAWTEIRFS